MDKLVITETQYTPEIVLNPAGELSFKGRSYPENTFEFYEPVLQWVKDYFVEGNTDHTVINMEIVYFNSSSSKLFFDLLDICFEQIEEHAVKVNWIYDKENESAEEAGEDFIADFEGMDIELVVKASN